jgi:hypothetical protein
VLVAYEGRDDVEYSVGDKLRIKSGSSHRRKALGTP